MRGSASAAGHFELSGFAAQQLLDSLRGGAAVRLRGVGFGAFDPVGAAAQATSWGELEAARNETFLRSATLTLQVQNRRVTILPASADLAGALLSVQGSCGFDGQLDLDVHADFQHVARHWIGGEDSGPPPQPVADVHLGGRINNLVVAPAVEVSKKADQPAGHNDTERAK